LAKLEWTRWQQIEVSDYLWWQADLVRQYQRPDQFVTHDFSGSLHRDVNEFQVARALDIVGVNVYHGTQDEFDGERQSFLGDAYRSLHHSNYLVTETNAQAIGWTSAEQYPPYDGQARLDVYSDLSSGANMVEYWHWATLNSGQETYWKGVLGHDREPNRVFNEMVRTGAELKKIGPDLVNLKIKNRVAILYSVDSANSLDFMPFTSPKAQGGKGKGDYTTLVEQIHRVLFASNVGVDFIVLEQANFSDYRIVIVPALYIADDALLRKLSNYVKAGGHVVMTFKSGFANENSAVRSVHAPGPLREEAGFSYEEFSSLAKPLALKGDPFQAGEQNKVFYWAEMIQPEHSKVLATYDHPFFGRWAAITENQFGEGTLTYEGTWLSDELQKKVLLRVLQESGLVGVDQHPPTVRVKHGINAGGKAIHYLINYGASETSFPYPYGAARDLLTDITLAPGQEHPPQTLGSRHSGTELHQQGR
jgi:beta-galactosidase